MHFFYFFKPWPKVWSHFILLQLISTTFKKLSHVLKIMCLKNPWKDSDMSWNLQKFILYKVHSMIVHLQLIRRFIRCEIVFFIYTHVLFYMQCESKKVEYRDLAHNKPFFFVISFLTNMYEIFFDGQFYLVDPIQNV